MVAEDILCKSAREEKINPVWDRIMRLFLEKTIIKLYVE